MLSPFMAAKGSGFFQVGQVLGEEIFSAIGAVARRSVEIVFKQFTGDERQPVCHCGGGQRHRSHVAPSDCINARASAPRSSG